MILMMPVLMMMGMIKADLRRNRFVSNCCIIIVILTTVISSSITRALPSSSSSISNNTYDGFKHPRNNSVKNKSLCPDEGNLLSNPMKISLSPSAVSHDYRLVNHLQIRHRYHQHHHPNETVNQKLPIIIGYLTNFYGRHSSNRQGLVISGAISYAIDQINNEHSDWLNGRELKLLYNDTSAISINGTSAVIWQWLSGAVAFFGPEDTCEVEATIAGALNLPMISYKCASSIVSNKDLYPTFARTHPPDVIVVRSVLALLQYYQWEKFGIVWYKRSEKFALIVSTIRSMAQEQNFEITVDSPFDDEFECCIQHKYCCGKNWYDVVEKTYKKTRIYLFLGGASLLPHFLLALKSRGLLENGDYVVISIEVDEDYFANQSYGFIIQRNDHTEYEENAIYEASRSLLILTRSLPESPNYPHFVEKVREYNKLPPFCLKDSMSLKRHITYYASYLYDAVILYAQALSQVLSEGYSEYDGEKIIEKIIAKRRYQSITGAWMNIDRNGDVQGNYTVLQPVIRSSEHLEFERQRRQSSKSRNSRARLMVKMNPIGLFEYDSNETISFVQINQVDWVRPGHVPLDEPPCGFDDNDCDNTKDARVREIVTAILMAIFIATLIIIIITYRGWKNEQEIDGLQWKVSRDDVQIKHKSRTNLSNCDSGSFDFHHFQQHHPHHQQYHLEEIGSDHRERNDASRTERISNNSDLLNSKEDDFEITYKGVVVSFKVLKFNKKSSTNPYDYLTRENKLEMKWLKEMHHQNINVFIGATIHEKFPCSVLLLSEYCAKGSLRDVLENEEIRLDEEFMSSLVHDITCGLSYLHKSDLRCHGNLKSTNCVVTSRFVVKLNDFGLFSFRKENPDPQIELYNKLWKAPETLRNPEVIGPESDMYSFGIILHEIIIRQGPFAIKLINDDVLFEELQKIVDEVRAGPRNNQLRRPDITITELHDDTIEIINACWHEDPRQRPTIDAFRSKLKAYKKFRPPPEKLMENMVKLMEVYQNQLEDLVYKRTQQLDDEKRKTETLLYQMLPESVARQLICGHTVIPEIFENVTIYFSDIVGFTKLSASSTPMEVVTFLNDLYCLFDLIVSQYNVYKVETIGDAYMVVSGLPIRNELHCSEIASMALEMLDAIKTFQIRHRPEQHLQLRIGIHTGPVVAGVVGTKMPRYCLFGDTVNTASRMESNGQALKIHISNECKKELELSGRFQIEERGLVFLKGKGDVKTYWLIGFADGSRPHFDRTRFTYVDSPWIQQDNKAPPISILDDLSSNRRGSLIHGNNEPNMAKIYKKALGAGGWNGSFSRLKSVQSVSCNTFRPKPDNHLSPKSIKKNWPFRIFSNTKIRSNSANHPEHNDDDVHFEKKKSHTYFSMRVNELNHHQNGEDYHINAKNMIKSTSYNMIESLNHHQPNYFDRNQFISNNLIGNDHNHQEDDVERGLFSNKPTNNQLMMMLTNEHQRNHQRLHQNDTFLPPKDYYLSDHSKNDSISPELIPLLVKKEPKYQNISNTKHTSRKSSLLEAEEDSYKNAVDNDIDDDFKQEGDNNESSLNKKLNNGIFIPIEEIDNNDLDNQKETNHNYDDFSLNRIKMSVDDCLSYRRCSSNLNDCVQSKSNSTIKEKIIQ